MSVMQELGKVSVTPKGEFSAEITYERLDIIEHEGNSYIAVSDVPAGTEVTDSRYWQRIASKGDKGDTGAKGPQGDPGPAGADGKDAVIDATLAQSGQAADAAKTGEAIGKLKNDLAEFKENVENNERLFEDWKSGFVSTGSGSPSNSPLRGIFTGLLRNVTIYNNDTTRFVIRVYRYNVESEEYIDYFMLSSPNASYGGDYKYRFFVVLSATQGQSNITELDVAEMKENISISLGSVVKRLDVFGNVIVVAKDGTGDYETISEAVANASNYDTIFIRNGEYEESIQTSDHLYLVGEDKLKTIIYNTSGNYDTPPLLVTNGIVKNLTIYAKKDSTKDYSNLTKFSYGLHLDTLFNGCEDRRSCEIDNCIIKSDFNDAIGAGMTTNSVYDIHDCLIETTSPNNSAFKCHIGNRQTSGSLMLSNNIFKSLDNGYGINLHNAGITASVIVDVTLNNNTLKRFINMSESNFALSEYCHGNSVDEINTI